ncbi:MAG: N-methyl-L-tryptophan oxidase [Bryobacteraceae bacterium]
MTYDVAVIGAGVFGSWTAHHLRRAGQRVILIDAYGPSNSRASSGGESRIIRCGYGPDEIYSRFARNSLPQWKDLSRRTNTSLFHNVGMLWLAEKSDPHIAATARVLTDLEVPHEILNRTQLDQRFPQFSVGDDDWAVYEPNSGALMARRSIQMLVQEMEQSGLEVLTDPVQPLVGTTRLASITTASGRTIAAGAYVFACGPWLPKLFPHELGQRIFPTRQEIFFFGPAPNEHRFAPPSMPCWIDVGKLYGIPDLENRGLKIADDEHGEPIDPDTTDRLISKESVEFMRHRLAQLFPAMRDAPLLETRVCQYENTANGDFLLDRHPALDNVWLAGGGSGHGFKHGPAVGEYLITQILGIHSPEPRFSFATKSTTQNRSVY